MSAISGFGLLVNPVVAPERVCGKRVIHSHVAPSIHTTSLNASLTNDQKSKLAGSVSPWCVDSGIVLNRLSVADVTHVTHSEGEL